MRLEDTVKLACDAQGYFRREIGKKKKADGSGYRQHCFTLGRDKTEAARRSLQLERVWDGVCQRWQRQSPKETECPLWDADTLAIGQAVARGESRVAIDVDDWSGNGAVAECAAAWLTQLRHDFPFIQIDFGNSEVQAVGMTRLEEAAKSKEEEVRWIRQVSSSQTLHQALDAFQTYIRANCPATAHTVVKINQITNIKAHCQDMPLAAFGTNEIDLLLLHWQSRPVAKHGKKMSVHYCKDIIKRIRMFLRWLHKSAAFEWRKPADYETTPLRVMPTQEERAAKVSPLQVKVYTLDQLGTLYEYASPLERTLMLLALNCGFGAAEVSSLQVAEIHLDCEHGHYPLVGSWVKRLRGKTEVYGEWILWEPTIQAIRWVLARRPQTKHTELLITAKGRPYGGLTGHGNRNQRIQNAWASLRARIEKDVAFPLLSFNKLRKTASDLVKRCSDGETAGVFLAHGQTVRSDDLADVYTNRHFDKVFQAQASVYALLSPLFARVAEPFPAGKKVRPRISLGKIRQIQDLRRQGYKLQAIAERVGLSRETVRYHCQRD